MEKYEGLYTNINGTGFENELAKIMSRYSKEGKPQVQQKPQAQDNAVVNQSQGYFSSAKKSEVSKPPVESSIKGSEVK